MAAASRVSYEKVIYQLSRPQKQIEAAARNPDSDGYVGDGGGGDCGGCEADILITIFALRFRSVSTLYERHTAAHETSED